MRRIVIMAAFIAAMFLSAACTPASAQAPVNNGTLLRQLYGIQNAPNCTLRYLGFTSTVTRMLPNSAARISECWINSDVSDVYIWFDATVSTSKGVHLSSGGGSFCLDFRTDSVLPTYEMWGVASGSSGVNVTEVDCAVQ